MYHHPAEAIAEPDKAGIDITQDSPIASWKPIPGWVGWYEVSDTAVVRSVTRTLTLSDGRVRTFPSCELSPQTGEYGHQYVVLSRQSLGAVMFIHVAMMAAFVGPKPDGLVVCHNDGDARNNTLSNLRYDTPSENTLDNVRNGTHHYARRDSCKWGHLLLGPNTRLGKNNQRVCRTCHNIRNRMSKARRMGRLVPDFESLAAVHYAEIMANYVPPNIPTQRTPADDEVNVNA